MIKFLYKLFNQDKIDRLNERLEAHRERTEQLEAEVREYKGYKLKYEVTKLYVEDEEALLELFEIAERNERVSNQAQSQAMHSAAQLQQSQIQQVLHGQNAGSFGGLFGNLI